MKWQVYDKTVRDDQSTSVDLILTDPPYGLPSNSSGAGNSFNDSLDDMEMREFAQFSKRCLVPGGCAFVFTSSSYHGRWIKQFREAGMKVCEHPFVIVKDPKGMQHHRNILFPQNCTEYTP